MRSRNVTALGGMGSAKSAGARLFPPLILAALLGLSACDDAEAPVNTTLPEDVVEAGDNTATCSPSEAAVELGASVSSGTLEVLAPLMDTDGNASKVYAASPTTCLPLSDLEALRKGAGLSASEPLPLRIGFDPNGKPSSYRFQNDYTPLMAEELATTPIPPREMRFGEASWTGGTALAVRWYTDYRKHLESTFTQSETTAPEPETTATSQGDVSWTPEETALIEEWHDANSRCRGGSGDEASTMTACEERDGAISPRLAAANICYGREDEYGYQHTMHRCGPTSSRFK